jgi:hypothetical protein
MGNRPSALTWATLRSLIPRQVARDRLLISSGIISVFFHE